MEALIAVTYRCNARCKMCNTWKNPSRPKDEISLDDLKKLPSNLSYINITGGEPFLRDDIEDIIELLLKKAKRIVVSTNGYLTERIVKIGKKFPNIGIRVSIDGLPKTNDKIRGLENGFEYGVNTIKRLKKDGVKDLGFGFTVSDTNVDDMMKIYNLTKGLNIEFSLALAQNSYYFHTNENKLTKMEKIISEIKKLMREQLKSMNPKNWFRAYFNLGYIHLLKKNKRLLPCTAGQNNFYVDAFGEIFVCNGIDWSIGNIKKQAFHEIWHNKKADKARNDARKCNLCWMICSTDTEMRKRKFEILFWILKNKFKRSL
jgi:MoaA/NifB/PqqE/SkfB family radical SAM enzyme